MACVHRIASVMGCDVQVQNALQTANTLNNVLLTSAGVGDSVYEALVDGLVSSDPRIYGAIIVFDPGDRSTRYVFRTSSTSSTLQVRCSPTVIVAVISDCTTNAVVTTTIRLRFDRATTIQRPTLRP